MAKTSGPKPRTISDKLLEVDISGLGKMMQGSGDPSMDETMRTMNRGLAMDMIGDFRDRMDYNRQVRMHEKEKMLRQREQVSKGVVPGMFNPMQEFMKGLSNPEWLKMWREMNPEERQDFMMNLQQMGMMSGTGMQSMGGMMPYLMFNQMRGNRGETLSVKDLAAMFSTGIETATKAMTSARGSNTDMNPLSLIGEIAKITDPYKAMADVASQRNYELMLKQIEKGGATGGMDKALENIQRTLEVFGGGSTSSADIEIAKIQSDSQYQMMNLQMQMNIEAERLRSEQSKWEQAGGILMSGMAAVAPVVGKGLQALGQQQGQRSRAGGGPQQQGSKPYAHVRCNECKEAFQVPLVEGKPPASVACPFCEAVLERK